MTAPLQKLWEESLPSSLRNDQVDLSSLPVNAAVLASDAGQQHQSRAAFGFVLPNGASTTRSFKEIDALSDAFAAYLVNELKLTPGQVIAVHLPTCLHYPIAVFGA